MLRPALPATLTATNTTSKRAKSAALAGGIVALARLCHAAAGLRLDDGDDFSPRLTSHSCRKESGRRVAMSVVCVVVFELLQYQHTSYHGASMMVVEVYCNMIVERRERAVCAVLCVWCVFCCCFCVCVCSCLCAALVPWYRKVLYLNARTAIVLNIPK